MSLEPGCPDCAAIGQRCGFHMSTLEDERAVLVGEVRRLRARVLELEGAERSAVDERDAFQRSAWGMQGNWLDTLEKLEELRARRFRVCADGQECRAAALATQARLLKRPV